MGKASFNVSRETLGKGLDINICGKLWMFVGGKLPKALDRIFDRMLDSVPRETLQSIDK